MKCDACKEPIPENQIRCIDKPPKRTFADAPVLYPERLFVCSKAACVDAARAIVREAER